MAEEYGIIAQSDPAAATDTEIFVIPAAKRAVLSNVTICNRSASGVQARLWFRPLGVATSAEQYVYYDITVPANDTVVYDGGVTLVATDEIYGRAASQELAFTVNGILEDAP